MVERLSVIAAKCPVHRTLDGEVIFSERVAWSSPRPPDPAPRSSSRGAGRPELPRVAAPSTQRGNFSAGLTRISDALRVRPNAPEALINLGRIQSELGDQEAAVATYRKVLTADPKSAMAHSNLSILLRKQGLSEEALTHCDKALQILPDYADAFNNRGNALFDLARFEEALTDYNKAVSLAPNHANAHLGRGNVFYELDRPADALAAFDARSASIRIWSMRGLPAARCCGSSAATKKRSRVSTARASSSLIPRKPGSAMAIR